MPAEHIEVNYAQLEQMARQFRTEADSVDAVYNAIQYHVEGLRSGGWLGRGAKYFYMEMDEDVLPGVRRLVEALDHAEQTVLELIKIYREAEETAANAFQRPVEIAAPGIMEDVRKWGNDLGNAVDTLKGVFDPASIEEGMAHLKETEAGKTLIEAAKQAGLRFQLPDGSYIGAENATQTVSIKFGDANSSESLTEAAIYSPAKKEIIVAESRMGSIQRGAMLAHEMQHALDDHLGLNQGGGGVADGLSVREKAEQEILAELRAHLDSEVRGYSRQNAVLNGTAYDGNISAEEREAVFKAYEKFYEEEFGEALSKTHNANVKVDVSMVNGELRVQITGLPG